MSDWTSRIVPTVAPPGERIPLLVDSDAAAEIDDLYAISLAIRAPGRFDIRGFVGTHFAGHGGPDSAFRSSRAIEELLAIAGVDYPVATGGDPLAYPKKPRASDGAQFIIERAREASPDRRLLVLCLGSASDVASALLLAPEITERIVVMFHGRSESTWPQRSTQFNIYGDILAAQYLLESSAPLIWFDTGTRLCASMASTETHLSKLGELGRYLHEFRLRDPSFQRDEKGFFDLGDVAWLLDPKLCTVRVVKAPSLMRWMYFDHERTNGEMLHVSEIDVERTWKLFYRQLGGGGASKGAER